MSELVFPGLAAFWIEFVSMAPKRGSTKPVGQGKTKAKGKPKAAGHIAPLLDAENAATLAAQGQVY